MNSDKYVMERQEVTTTHSHVPIIYWMQKSYSGRFYAQRPIHLINTEDALDSLSSEDNKFYLMIQHKREGEIPKRIKENLILVDSSMKRSMYTNVK